VSAPAGGAEASWADAALAAALGAVDPAGMGGVVVRARPGPVRDRWLETVRALVPDRPMPRVPLNVGDDRLVGGLDLTATLQAGRPVVEHGVLAAADGGLVVLPMAERLEHGTAARIAAVLDTGLVEPGGGAAATATRFAVVALDESGPDEERPAGGLLDRLGLHLTLDPIPPRQIEPTAWTAGHIEAARSRVAAVTVDDEAIEAVCAAAVSLGIDSLRAPTLALNTARASAALSGREAIAEDDIACAARLVLAPRATAMPASEDEPSEDDTGESGEEQSDGSDDGSSSNEQDEQGEQAPSSEAEDSDAAPGEDTPETETEEAPAEPESGSGDDEDEQASSEAMAEVVLEAAKAALPEEGLLEQSRQARAARGAAAKAGKAGALQGSGQRGRPAGVRRGEPGPRARLNVVETLRSAVPWQPLRRAEAGDEGPRIRVRREDLRVTPFRTRRDTVTIFVVDASGSAALHRLSEAKGAVELLLADCYVRRDQVALISFRAAGAEELLPPTRSLVRAKRELADLPGGGGTPLAAGIEAAAGLAERVEHGGMTPTVVFLTDGRANVARDGSHDREAAERDAFAAARRLFAAGITALLVDTAPRSRPAARDLAAAMGARHLPLPHGDARSLSAVVRGQGA